MLSSSCVPELNLSIAQVEDDLIRHNSGKNTKQRSSTIPIVDDLCLGTVQSASTQERAQNKDRQRNRSSTISAMGQYTKQRSSTSSILDDLCLGTVQSSSTQDELQVTFGRRVAGFDLGIVRTCPASAVGVCEAEESSRCHLKRHVCQKSCPPSAVGVCEAEYIEFVPT